MDKELANRLLDAVEKLYLENLVFRAALQKGRWAAMDKVLAEAQADPELTVRVQKQFAPVRERIRQDSDLEQVIQEFLQAVPPKKDVN